jgi:hypothetical protein
MHVNDSACACVKRFMRNGTRQYARSRISRCNAWGDYAREVIAHNVAVRANAIRDECYADLNERETTTEQRLALNKVGK